MKINIPASAAAAYYNQPAWDPLVKKHILEPCVEHVGHRPACDVCNKPLCCSQTIVCSMYEGLAMAHVVKLSGIDSQEFRRKLDVRDELMQTETIWQYWERKLPCVFLSERGLCSIYQARPEVCRSFYTWLTPKDCEKIDEGIQFTLENKANTLRMSLDYSCMSLQKSWGLDYSKPLIGTLPGTVLCALYAWDAQTDEARERIITSFQWLSEERGERILKKEPMFNASDFLAMMTGNLAR